MLWLSSLASLIQQWCYYCLMIVQVAVIDAVTPNIDDMKQNSVQWGNICLMNIIIFRSTKNKKIWHYKINEWEDTWKLIYTYYYGRSRWSRWGVDFKWVLYSNYILDFKWVLYSSVLYIASPPLCQLPPPCGVCGNPLRRIWGSDERRLFDAFKKSSYFGWWLPVVIVTWWLWLPCVSCIGWSFLFESSDIIG